MAIYINRKGDGITETVEEHDKPQGKKEWAEFRKMLADMRVSDPTGQYWASSRCCKGWDEK